MPWILVSFGGIRFGRIHSILITPKFPATAHGPVEPRRLHGVRPRSTTRGRHARFTTRAPGPSFPGGTRQPESLRATRVSHHHHGRSTCPQPSSSSSPCSTHVRHDATIATLACETEPSSPWGTDVVIARGRRIIMTEARDLGIAEREITPGVLLPSERIRLLRSRGAFRNNHGVHGSRAELMVPAGKSHWYQRRS